MLKIRLQRIGKKGQAHFRVVIMEHSQKTKGEFLELLGTYNPHQKKFKVDRERVEYWMSKGAQVSPTVNNLMVNYKFWDRPKMPSWKPKRREAKAAEPAIPEQALHQNGMGQAAPEASPEAPPEEPAAPESAPAEVPAEPAPEQPAQE